MMRRVGIVAAALLALVACCMIGWGAGRLSAGSAHPEDQQAVALAESLSTARAEAASRLQSWRDSLRSMPRDTVVRRVVRYIAAHDAARVWRDSGPADTGEVIRWLAAADSGCRVSLDSANGETMQARFDADQCADELQKRPTTCSGWSAFGAGVAVMVMSAGGYFWPSESRG